LPLLSVIIPLTVNSILGVKAINEITKGASRMSSFFINQFYRRMPVFSQLHKQAQPFLLLILAIGFSKEYITH